MKWIFGCFSIAITCVKRETENLRLMEGTSINGKAVKTVLLTLIVIAFACCATHSMRGDFEKSINGYGELVRQHKFDAASVFATEAMAEEFLSRARNTKNVKMVDYRIVGISYNEEKGEADVQAEIDYYTLSAFRLKTLVDTQKWVYVYEGGTKQWKLKTALPEFK